MPAAPRFSESTYLELVRSLFSTLAPSALMAALFILTAWVCAETKSNTLLTELGILGAAVGVARLAVLIGLRTVVRDNGLDVPMARRFERIFALSYLAFAAILGLFAAFCLKLCPVEEQLSIAALVVGCAAGVAAGVSLRPWIGIPAVLLSVIPLIISALFQGDGAHLLLALLLAALMVGGIASMLRRYRAAVEMIEMRTLFASLARQDPLTGLANRLALQDAFRDSVESNGGRTLVLHCLDLDRFKPVNDTHGHLIGDLLLQAVAGRLQRLVRPGDLAVRLGGDEFAILQTGVGHADEAELMARRIARAVAEPYAIEGHCFQIGASVGSASSDRVGADLAQLLGSADVALYAAKHDGGGVRSLAG